MTFLKQDFEAPDDEFSERTRKGEDAWAVNHGYTLASKYVKRDSIIRIISLVSLILAVSSLVAYIMGGI